MMTTIKSNSYFIFLLILITFSNFDHLKDKFESGLFKIECNNFLTTDNLHYDFSPFQFVNNNPNKFVDRDGQLPIQIAPGISHSRAKKIFKLFKKLSNDKLELRINPATKTHSIDIVKYAGVSKISNPSGTNLTRELLNIRDQQLTIDYENTMQIASNSKPSPTTCNVEGTVQLRFTGRRAMAKGISGREFQQKSDVVINLNGSRLPRALYFDQRKNKIIVSDSESLFPQEVVLFHEMIHARYFMTGDQRVIRDAHGRFHNSMDENVFRVPYPNSSFGENIPLEEARTVGLTPYSPKSAIEGVDISYHPSENQLRRELRLPYRIFYGNLR